MNIFFLMLLMANSVFGQICNRVTPKSIKDLDNLPLAQSGCLVTNIIKPYAASNLPWNPSSVPSRGYYRLNMTFQEPSLITSCDFWASTDGSHNPTGLKFYDKPGGTLLASTSSFTTRMTQKTYNFLFIPPVVLPSIYFEVYKSTTWQVWVDTLSCNTCYDPSETPTPTVSKSVTPSKSPVSVSPTSKETLTSTITPSEAPSRGVSVTTSITKSSSPTSAVSESVTLTASPTRAASESVTFTVSPTNTATVSLTKTLTRTTSFSKSSTTSPTASAAVSSSESESPSPIFKQSPTPISILMSNSTVSPVNGTFTTIISDLAQSQLLTGIGGAALGASSLALLIMAAKYISKKFAPGPDGKRPSISEVASSLFSSAKAKATEIMEDVKGDIEQQVKAVVKDPKSALAALKDPNAALKSVKEAVALNVNRVVTKHVPASQQSAVLKMVKQVAPNAPAAPVAKPVAVEDVAVEDVSTDAPPPDAPPPDAPSADAALPNQVPDAPLSGNSVNIQIDEADLERVQQMLSLMNKPHTVVPTTTDQPSL